MFAAGGPSGTHLIHHNRLANGARHGGTPMRTSGLGLSIALIAVGAVLAWAVTFDAEGIDLNMVGVILFVVGIVGAVISLIAVLTARTDGVRDREVVVERERR